MKTDKYNETLHKLFLKGIINEKQLIEKMENRRKPTEFEMQVNKAILESMDDGYVKKTFNRIYKDKQK